MNPLHPRSAASLVETSARGACGVLARWRAAQGAAAFAAVLAARLAGGCAHELPPVAPGEPIPAEPEVTLGSMDAECDALVAAMAAYKACPNLEDDDRRGIDAWTQGAQQDFAAGKKAKPEPNAQRAIAAACHKAIASVNAANERCHAGPKPKS